MRPNFLSRPGIWTRAARTAQTPVEYACSIERTVAEHRGAGKVVGMLLAVAALIWAAALVVGRVWA